MPRELIHRHQRENFLQTLWLLLGMAAVFAVASLVLAGWSGLLIAAVLVITSLVFSGSLSTAMVLRSYHARPISPEAAPELTRMFRDLCRKAQLEPPPLYYIPSSLPNAFAAGKGRGAIIAVSDGLLRLLNQRELAGVLAHELSHILNEDVRVMSMADAITRTTSFLSRLGLMMLFFSLFGPLMGLDLLRIFVAGSILFFAPGMLVLLQLAISRTREFDADLGAAELTGDPAGLASALIKLQPRHHQGWWDRVVRPGPGRAQPAALRTHPPTEERIQRLLALQDRGDASADLRPTLHSGNDIRWLQDSPQPVQRRPRYHARSGLWH